MSIGYLGWCKIDNVSATPPANLLLCNSTGLNRRIDPILSKAVWGAGWGNAASTVAYANSQQPFEGNVNFELQYNSIVWNLFSAWLTTNRVVPLSIQISPNGYINYLYQYTTADIQSGCWARSARISIKPDAAITVDMAAVAIKRIENVTVSGGNYAANLQVGLPTSTAPLSTTFTPFLMNPSPYNRNPIPGWYVSPSISWNGVPPEWVALSTPYGFSLAETNFSVDNHTQIVHAVSGQPGPLAVIQGTVEAMGDISLWRDGPITDPYDATGNPSGFTATNAFIKLQIATGTVPPPSPQIFFNNIILREDAYNVGGQDTLIPRTFGFYAIGDGVHLPCVLGAFA